MVKCKNLLLRHSEGKLGSVETLNGVFLVNRALVKLSDLENVNLLCYLLSMSRNWKTPNNTGETPKAFVILSVFVADC